jgi:hypothetical protein
MNLAIDSKVLVALQPNRLSAFAALPQLLSMPDGRNSKRSDVTFSLLSRLN